VFNEPYLISEMKFKCRESGFAAAESRRGHDGL